MWVSGNQANYSPKLESNYKSSLANRKQNLKIQIFKYYYNSELKFTEKKGLLLLPYLLLEVIFALKKKMKDNELY